MAKYIETKAKSYKTKKTTKKIAVIDGKEKQTMENKKTYKQAKKLHRQAIRQLRKEFRKAKRQHKLLIRQAKTVYQLSK